MNLTKNSCVYGEADGAADRRSQQKYTTVKELKRNTSANDAHQQNDCVKGADKAEDACSYES